MTNNEAMARIDELENEGFVIVNVMFENKKVGIEMTEDLTGATGFEVVTVEQFEENGYDVEGLETIVK